MKSYQLRSAPTGATDQCAIGLSQPASIGQDRSEMNIIFIHSALDDAGLTAAEFRVYAHLSRRAGSGKAWPSLSSICDVCKCRRSTAVKAIKSLESKNMIK